jgi:nicotinamide-nucleotide amidase
MDVDPLYADALLRKKAEAVVQAAARQALTLVTAESCTGGRIAAILTDAPAASRTVHGGFVIYTEACKKALGVPADLLDKHGAVSEPIARLLAETALARSPADIAVSVTGVAGPSTDDDKNPVGLVYFAASRKGHPTEVVKRMFGEMDRAAVLFNTVEEALALLGRMINRSTSESAGAPENTRLKA